MEDVNRDEVSLLDRLLLKERLCRPFFKLRLEGFLILILFLCHIMAPQPHPTFMRSRSFGMCANKSKA